MKPPILGRTVAGQDLAIDFDRLIGTRMLLQADSGAGKSWAVRRLLEQTHGRAQQLVLDVEGEFHTLRERFDYVLVAGRGGDLAPDPRAAALLARRLLELGASAILDIFELKAHERERFVHLFLDAMVNAPRALWHPVLLVIDEAHVFCPEGGKSECGGAVIDLMTRGRKRGFCGVLATQRLAALNKNAAAQASNKLIGRTCLDADMKRAGDELGLPRSEHLSLRGLGDGHFYAFGPAISREVVEVTVGPVVTTHPKAGAAAAPTTPPRAQIVSMLSKLADLPKEAEQEAQDLAGARKRIRELEGENRRLVSAAPPVPETKVERVEVQVLTGRDLERLEGVASSLRQAAADATTAARDVEAAVARVKAAPPRPAVRATRVTPIGAEPRPGPRPGPIGRRDAPGSIGRAPDGALAGVEQKILDELAALAAIGIDAPDRIQLAFMAGYTNARSGGFSEPLGRLIADGLVHAPAPGIVSLSDDGRAAARPVERPTTSDELQRRIVAKLDGVRGRILRELIDLYPESITRPDLAARLGYSNPRSGGFSEPLGSLCSLGLVETPGSGLVVAGSSLFLGN